MNLLRLRIANLSERQIIVLKLLLLIVICIYVAKNAAEQIRYSPVEKDARQILTMALNAYNLGVLSIEHSGNAVRPTAFREPGYPLFLSLGMSVIFKRNKLDISRVSEDTTPDTQAKLNKLKYLNIVILFAIILASFVATYFFTGNYAISLLTIIMVGNDQVLLKNVNVFLTENFTALLVLLTGLSFAFIQLKSDRLRYYFASGLTLSLLTLSKAIFFYFFPIAMLLLIYINKRQKLPTRRVLKNISVFALGFLMLTLSWMSRNYYHFDRFFLTQRGGVILRVRAEYDKMTPTEFAASFLYWTPNDMAKKLLHKLFTKEDYHNLDRDNIYGYRHKVRSRRNFLRNTYNDHVFADKILLQEARDRILQNPFKHLLTTIPFAYRGIFVTQRLYIYGDFYLIKGTYLCFILFLSLIIMTICSLKEKNIPLFIFFLPALFSFSFYSLFSHNIPRYNTILMPVLWVATMLFVYQYLLKYVISAVARMRNRLSKKR